MPSIPVLRRVYERLVLFGGLGLFALMSLALSLPALLLTGLLPRAKTHPLGRRMMRAGCAIYLRALALTGTCRFELDALDILNAEGPLIIAPNHPGLIDAVLVLSRVDNVACIAKGPLLDNPLYGAAARLAGYIRNDSPLAMVIGAADELRAGGKLLLFPEGTRTVNPPVNRLAAAVAVVAARARVSVQTVIIETDTPFLGKRWPLLRQPDMPMHWRIRLGRRFPPPSDARAFLRELERYFRAELATAPPPGPAPHPAPTLPRSA